MSAKRVLSVLAITSFAFVVLAALPAWSQIGDEPKYKFCRPNGTCASAEQNTDCSDEVLNFCISCTGYSTVMKKCKGNLAATPCDDDTPADMCGNEMIGYCSVDNCATYSANGSNTCSGTSCVQ